MKSCVSFDIQAVALLSMPTVNVFTENFICLGLVVVDCSVENSSNLFMSLMLERVMAHLKVGAQKKMVSGPAGCASSVFIGEGSGEANKAAYNAGTKLMGI